MRNICSAIFFSKTPRLDNVSGLRLDWRGSSVRIDKTKNGSKSKIRQSDSEASPYRQSPRHRPESVARCLFLEQSSCDGRSKQSVVVHSRVIYRQTENNKKNNRTLLISRPGESRPVSKSVSDASECDSTVKNFREEQPENRQQNRIRKAK